jgi:hypothetical protein
MKSAGLQSSDPFPGTSDLLKNSASASASPVRVKIDSLDLPLTHPLAQPRPSFQAPETTMSCRSGRSPETHRDLLTLPGGFSGAISRVETLTVAGTGFAAARYGTGHFFRRSAFMRGSNRLSSLIMRGNLGRSWRTHFCVQRSQSCERASVISPLPPASVPSMKSPGLQSSDPFPGTSDLLKNSASASASPWLRVKIDSLDLPLTHPLAQPRPSFPAPETTTSCRSGRSPETHRDLLILPGGFSGTISRVEVSTENKGLQVSFRRPVVVHRQIRVVPDRSPPAGKVTHVEACNRTQPLNLPESHSHLSIR